MVSTAKKELAEAGLVTVRKSKNPNRHADHIRIKDIWPANFQEFSVPLANALHEESDEEESQDVSVSVPLANAENGQRSISERSVPLANSSVLLANQRRSQEEDPLKKEEESLPTEETSLGTAVAVPNTADLSEDRPAAPKSVAPKKPRTARPITPIPHDHWLAGLLDDYREDFDGEALNDWHWWGKIAKTFPDGQFTKRFVVAAFADLVLWFENNPARKPHTKKGWRDRIHKSLDWFYTNKHSRRMPSQGGHYVDAKEEARRAAIANFVKGS
jgi:hypothetical protein